MPCLAIAVWFDGMEKGKCVLPLREADFYAQIPISGENFAKNSSKLRREALFRVEIL